MTAIVGTIMLSEVPVSSLPATVAGYLVSFSEAGEATVPAPIAVALNATSVSVELGVGSWTASIIAVDAQANALTAPVHSNTIVLVAPAMVNVPVGIILATQ